METKLYRPTACSNSPICHGYKFLATQRVCKTCQDSGITCELCFVSDPKSECAECHDKAERKVELPGSHSPPLCLHCAHGKLVIGKLSLSS